MFCDSSEYPLVSGHQGNWAQHDQARQNRIRPVG
jgi:hypothetical protein